MDLLHKKHHLWIVYDPPGVVQQAEHTAAKVIKQNQGTFVHLREQLAASTVKGNERDFSPIQPLENNTRGMKNVFRNGVRITSKPS